jgi:hypothetical protein
LPEYAAVTIGDSLIVINRVEANGVCLAIKANKDQKILKYIGSKK